VAAQPVIERCAELGRERADRDRRDQAGDPSHRVIDR
jgi:hypothetical protein